MSHVSEISGIEIRDLNALSLACEKLGMELVQNAKTFRAYSTNPCDHMIRVKGDANAYQIGVSENADGTYRLKWDTWGAQGRKLIDRIGEKGEIIKKHYASELAKSLARRKGFHIREQTLENGGIRLCIRKGTAGW